MLENEFSERNVDMYIGEEYGIMAHMSGTLVFELSCGERGVELGC